MDDHESENYLGVDLADEETVLRPPPLWDVVLLNDDYTPMDFVVFLLVEQFGHNEEQAIQIMLSVHQNGRGVAGTYSRDIAETKAAIAMQLAKNAEFPLHAVIRQRDE